MAFFLDGFHLKFRLCLMWWDFMERRKREKGILFPLQFHFTYHINIMMLCVLVCVGFKTGTDAYSFPFSQNMHTRVKKRRNEMNVNCIFYIIFSWWYDCICFYFLLFLFPTSNFLVKFLLKMIIQFSSTATFFATVSNWKGIEQVNFLRVSWVESWAGGS